MLTEIHFLLTYTCNYQCDHCFLFSGPDAVGTFTINQLRRVFDEIPKIGSIKKVYFEGGEAFLYYPLLLEGIRIAHDLGLETGIVTNSYWATSVEDAELWLKPFVDLGINEISLSDDLFHFEKNEESPARIALKAAIKLGLPAGRICIEEPIVKECETNGKDKGASIVGGNVVFRGRAVGKLTKGLPAGEKEEFTQCPYEDLENPQRVHIDSFGNVHLCQGLSMGNIWETSLSLLVQNYTASSHPICRPLVGGGPVRLAREHNVSLEDKYVDECHFCYQIRLNLIDRYPQYLTPRQVYGLE